MSVDVGSHCFAVTISSALEYRKVDIGPFARAYGLSRAETRLAEALLLNKSGKDHAEDLGLSPNTTRVQMQSILNKTQCKKQAELMSLMCRALHLIA